MDEELTFGVWLKQRRRALDMTQRDLADRVGCAIGTVRRLESDDLRPSRQVAERLAATLAIPATLRESFIAFARDVAQTVAFALPPEVPPAAEGLRATPTYASLPQQLTPLLGRTHTVSAICAVLLRPTIRLLTLTGPPGVGKTRLGLQVATEIAARFSDGVVFVPLAPVSTPDLVPAALAQALGLRDDGRSLAESLTERLFDREMLLLIDNMEHVVAAAPLLAHLLRAAPRLKLLVTSRVSLHLTGEHEFVVPPLALPETTDAALELLEHNPAVALFCARAQAVQGDFTLDAANAPAIAAICRRLDGLPLAIELAAMRCKLFTPKTLLDRLEHRLPLLRGGLRDAPARQQTVESAIAWSYDLLTSEQQRLFAALGSFSGGWTLHMAEALLAPNVSVTALQAQVVHDLAALVDHSLVQREIGPDDEERFTMLEVIREYALGRQVEHLVEAAVRERHAQLMLALGRAGAAGLQGPDQIYWLKRLEAELANIRSALSWSTTRSGDSALGLALAGKLWWFWWASGRVAEGRRWLEALLPHADQRTPERAEALTGIAALAFFAGDFAAALPYTRQAMEETEALALEPLHAYAQLNRGSIALLWGDTSGARDVAASVETLRATGADGAWFLGTALVVRTIVAMLGDDFAGARQSIDEGLAVFQRLGQTYGIAAAHNYLGDVARLQEDWVTAKRMYETSLALMRESGVRSDLPALLHNLGYVALHEGDVVQARAHFVASLALHRDVGNRTGVAESLYGIAAVATVEGNPRLAAQLFGAAAAMEQASEMPPWKAEAAERARYLARAKEQLLEEEWVDMVAIGGRLPFDQVLAKAVEEGYSQLRK